MHLPGLERDKDGGRPPSAALNWERHLLLLHPQLHLQPPARRQRRGAAGGGSGRARDGARSRERWRGESRVFPVKEGGFVAVLLGQGLPGHRAGGGTCSPGCKAQGFVLGRGTSQQQQDVTSQNAALVPFGATSLPMPGHPIPSPLKGAQAPPSLSGARTAFQSKGHTAYTIPGFLFF